MIGKKCIKHNKAPNVQDNDGYLSHLQATASQEELSKVYEFDQSFRSATKSTSLLMLDALVKAACSDQISFLNKLIAKAAPVDIVGQLPLELSMSILKLVGHRTIVQASAVSKKWHQLCQDETLWKRLCTQHIGKRCDDCGVSLPFMRRLHTRHAQMDVDDVIARMPVWKSIYIERYRIEQNWKLNRYEQVFLTARNNQLLQNTSTMYRQSRDSDDVTCLQYCNEMSLLICGYYCGTIRYWTIGSEGTTFSLTQTLKFHCDKICSLQFDSMKLMCASCDGSISIISHKGVLLNRLLINGNPVRRTMIDFSQQYFSLVAFSKSVIVGAVATFDIYNTPTTPQFLIVWKCDTMESHVINFDIQQNIDLNGDARQIRNEILKLHYKNSSQLAVFFQSCICELDLITLSVKKVFSADIMDSFFVSEKSVVYSARGIISSINLSDYTDNGNGSSEVITKYLFNQGYFTPLIHIGSVRGITIDRASGESLKLACFSYPKPEVLWEEKLFALCRCNALWMSESKIFIATDQGVCYRNFNI